MTIRRSFSREFKIEAVRLADASGNTAQAARELGENIVLKKAAGILSEGLR